MSSPVSPYSTSDASSLVGSLSKLDEVSAISGPAPSLVPPLSSPELLSQGLGSLAPDLVFVLCSSQQASPASPRLGKQTVGQLFMGVSS